MLTAIPTRYKGYRFRSRLEARWAVYFDEIGVEWEYEPEGFRLDAGPYLPDFWLKTVRMWAEVKPDRFVSCPEDPRNRGFAREIPACQGLSREEYSLAKGLAVESGYPVLVLLGTPSQTTYWAIPTDPDQALCVDYVLGDECLDGHRFCGPFWFTDNPEPRGDRHWNSARRAVERARSARFEHGESE